MVTLRAYPDGNGEWAATLEDDGPWRVAASYVPPLAMVLED
jgi:hypothetical protein